MQESYVHNLRPERRLRNVEIELLERLIAQANDVSCTYGEISDLKVQEMPDGGMGSLYFVQEKAPLQRAFGRRIAELQFNDDDGVLVSVALNVDKEGKLYEMDVWKVDFTRVIRLDPDHAAPTKSA